MIIGIVADTHFGYPRFYEDSFKQGEEAFSKACELSDVVIVAGDIFDTKVPKLEVLNRTMAILGAGKRKRWSVQNRDSSIPVVAIHGTHERRAKGSVNPVNLLESSGFITDADEKCVVFEKDGEKIAIHGFGGVPDDYVKGAISASTYKLIEGAFNVFVFHQTISDFFPMAKGIQIDELPPGFDLYVCGHMHKRTIETRNGKKLIIPGSTVITQLRKDEMEPRAFVLFDTKALASKVIEIESRPYFFSELGFDGAESSEIKRLCRNEIDGVLSRNKSGQVPIIKLRLSGKIKEGLRKDNIDLNDVISEYNGKAIVEIDNSLDSQSLQERIEIFKKMYEERKSAREVGIEILKAKSPNIPVEEFFEKLSDEKNIDSFVSEINGRNRKG